MKDQFQVHSSHASKGNLLYLPLAKWSSNLLLVAKILPHIHTVVESESSFSLVELSGTEEMEFSPKRVIHKKWERPKNWSFSVASFA